MPTDPTTCADGSGAPPLLYEGTPAALAELAAACAQCRRCGLADSRQHVVVGRGNQAARLLLIGEAPGAEEDASGLPFVGRAGKLLEQLLAEAGFDSERDLFIANVIKCRPPGNRKPSRAEIAACLPWLAQQIARQRPQLIGLLGATALEALLGIKGGITKLRGQWLHAGGLPWPGNPAQPPQRPQKPPQKALHNGLPNDLQQAVVLPIDWQNIGLMPLLHPSYLLRNPSGQEGTPKWLTLQDLRQIRCQLEGLGLANSSDLNRRRCMDSVEWGSTEQ